MLAEVTYHKVDDQGLHISVQGESRILSVDNVVVCAGQEPLKTMYETLKKAGQKVHVIGGAKEAAELDAKRAIKEASYLAAMI